MDIAQRTYVPSKTRRPEVPASAIERVGLNDRLDAVLDHPITLVTAPAGFGKSWAVAGWLQDDARPPSCWVTVDGYDDDAVRLWTHLIGAVRDAGLSAAAAEAAGLITGSPAGWPRIVDALAAGLAEGAEPFVIVLDDIHTVTAPEALASLGQFLAQLPATTHVVFVGRRGSGFVERLMLGSVADRLAQHMRAQVAVERGEAGLGRAGEDRPGRGPQRRRATCRTPAACPCSATRRRPSGCRRRRPIRPRRAIPNPGTGRWRR